MNHPAPQPEQAGAPSAVEMIVMVILFLWLASMPSHQSGPHRATHPDHPIAERLHAELNLWMKSSFHGTPLGSAYRHLRACIVEPE